MSHDASKSTDRALNALFDAEREAMGVSPHADPSYFALLDRLARGATPAIDVSQGASPLVGAGGVTAFTIGAAVAVGVAVLAGAWGGSTMLDRGRAAGASVTAMSAPAVMLAPAPLSAPAAPAAPDMNEEPAAVETQTGAAVEATAPHADSTPSGARERARRAPASARAEDLAEELRLLSAARNAWKAGRTSEALARLDEHERRFARGLLREDRGALEAVLLCETGKLAEGRAKARRFLARHPRSTLVDTVRSACP